MKYPREYYTLFSPTNGQISIPTLWLFPIFSIPLRCTFKKRALEVELTLTLVGPFEIYCGYIFNSFEPINTYAF